MTITTREIHLASRPDGSPRPDNFKLVERQLASAVDGQILVRNRFMSVDPYMRGRMTDRQTFIAPFAIDAVLDGAAVGVVVQSSDPDFNVGDTVSHFSGWCEYAIVDASTAKLIDATVVPIQAYLGPLGLPGHAAYFGLTRIAMVEEGATVFVSAAAGAVGSIAVQIARLKGCRVVGSVGSEAKAQWLRDEIGVDTVINYHAERDLTAALRDAVPNGIDAYFDNVGGEHLEAAIAVANDFARFALCGMVGQYNSAPVGPSNIYEVVEKSLLLQGFVGINHMETWPAFTDLMTGWIVDQQIQSRETIVQGLERAPEALIGLFSGDNIGKMLVRLEE